MPDKLSVTLEATNAAKATAEVELFRKTVIGANADINRSHVAGTTALDKQVAGLQTRADDVRRTFQKLVNVDGGTLDASSRSALRLQKEAFVVQQRLKEIASVNTAGKSASFLRILSDDAVTAELTLARLERRALAAKAATAAFGGGGGHPTSIITPGGQLRGLGPGFRAAGLTQIGIEETTVNAAIVAAKAVGITAGGVAVFGLVAAAGVAIVKISEHLRVEAERRLKAEEGIAKAANNQIIAAREQLITFQKADALRERERKFQEHLGSAGTADRDALTRQIDLLKKLRNIDPTGPNSEEFNANIQAAEQRLNALNQKATSDADANFNQRNENFKAAQLQAKEFEKKRIEAVNAGRQKVNELGKSTDELFQNLFAKSTDNPFVRVFTDAEQAIQSTRLATSALSKDLQKTAADLVATQNANALFAARLDSTLSAVNLRVDAAGFRGTGSTKTADDIAARALARFKRDLAEGLFRNPENLAIFRSGTSPQTGLELFNFQRQVEQSGGLFRNPQFDEDTRRRLAEQPANQTVADRLQKQLDAIAALTPGNDTQRADIDRRIIALTQGLRPEDLTDAQRGAAATARENEAARAENAEAAARAQRAESLDVQKRIDKNIAELLKVANSDGLTGVIRIINNAEDTAAVELGKRPTARDVTQLTDQ